MTENISLDDIGRRLDDLQREAAHYRLVFNVILNETKALHGKVDSLTLEMQAQRSRSALLDSRIGTLDSRIEMIDWRTTERLDRIDGRLDRIEQVLERLLEIRQ